MTSFVRASRRNSLPAISGVALLSLLAGAGVAATAPEAQAAVAAPTLTMASAKTFRPAVDSTLSKWTPAVGSWTSTGGVLTPTTTGDNLLLAKGVSVGGETTVTGSLDFSTDGLWGGIAINVVDSGTPGKPDSYVLRMKRLGANGVWQLLRMDANVATSPGVLASGSIYGGTGAYGLSLSTQTGGNVVVRITRAGINPFRQELNVPAALRLSGGQAGAYAMTPAASVSNVAITSTGGSSEADYVTSPTAASKGWLASGSSIKLTGVRSSTSLNGTVLGDTFGVRADVTAASDWAGISFNRTVGSYVLRYHSSKKLWQLVDLAADDNTATLIAQGALPATLDPSKPVTLTATKSSVGTVSVGLSQGATALASQDVTLPTDGIRSGGTAGVWASAANTTFTGFTETVRNGWTTDVSDTLIQTAGAGLGINWRQLSGVWDSRRTGVGATTMTSSAPISGALAIRSDDTAQPSTGFAVSADVTLGASSGWSGIVWNATDANNFNAFQINPSGNSWRAIQVVGGYTSLLAQGRIRESVDKALTLRALQVAADGGVVVSATASGKTLVSATTYPGTSLTGGQPGLLTNGTTATFSKFTLMRLGDKPLSTAPSSTMKFLPTTNTAMRAWTPVNGAQVAGSQAITLPVKTYGMSKVGQTIINSPDNKTQYVAFYNETGRIMVGKRSIASGPNTPWNAGDFVTLNDPASPNATLTKTDSHNYLSMAFGPDGNLNLSGNMHASALTFFRTTTPGDLTTFTPVHNMVNAAQEKSVTYPMFFSMPAGNGQPARFFFTFRTGSSGDGEQIYYVTTDGKTWSQITSPINGLTSADGSTYSAYITSGGVPIIRDGWFYLAWDWRKGNGDAGNGTQVLVMRSREFSNWETIGGDKLPATVTFDTYKTHPGILVADIPTQCGQLNGLDQLGFDEKNTPIMSYSKFDTCDTGPGTNQTAQYLNGWGSNQIYVAKWNGQGWTENQVTKLASRWAPTGGGAIPFSIGVGAVVPMASIPGKLSSNYKQNSLLLPAAIPGGTMLVLDPDTFRPISEGGWRNGTPYVNLSGSPYTLPSGMVWNSARTALDSSGNQYVMVWGSYPTTVVNGQSSDSGRTDPINPQSMVVYYATP